MPRDETPTRDPQQIIDEQARRIAWPRDRAWAVPRAAGPPARAPVRAERRIALLQQHLITEFAGLFTFLYDPRRWTRRTGAAEQALRPAVVTRKLCGGGTRTRRGADSQQVLASVLRTTHQRGHDATAVLVALLTAPTPTVPAAVLFIDPLTRHRPTPNVNAVGRCCWKWW